MKLLSPLILLALPCIAAQKEAPSKPATTSEATNALASTGEIQAVIQTWQQDGYAWTPKVHAAYLAFAKAEALKKLAIAGKALPADFLAWIDSDPTVRKTVYGARLDPSGVLLWLRSLEIDLGADAVRNKYPQLALAVALANSKDADKADITPRPPLILRIGGDPRVQVNTKPTDRPLDDNDHIINFLNDHAPIPDDGRLRRVVYPELKYDDEGKPVEAGEAEPEPADKDAPTMRKLVAADVFASVDLEREFNEYMAAHGSKVRIQCGDKRLNWRSNSIDGIDTRGTRAAYEIFLKAYQEKGYMPKARDAKPSPAELCAYYIRNNESAVSEINGKKPAWPCFPLNAPWPTLMMLAQSPANQSLREMNDIWEGYRDRGVFHGYGEYTGQIAQFPIYQAARRLTPYAYSGSTIQMMLKDGGVCGTMGAIAAHNNLALGIPSMTAAQPGHCCFVRFAYDAKNHIYACVGGQYATGGDNSTTPHVAWLIGDVEKQRGMPWFQSLAWAVNYGFEGYLDSTVAYSFFKRLPESESNAHGLTLLTSAAKLNPYNFLLVEGAVAVNGRPDDLAVFWRTLKPQLASGKPGCPQEGLYNLNVKRLIFPRLATLPVPTEKRLIDELLAFMAEEGCESQVTIANYKIARDGLPAFIAGTEADFNKHVLAARTDATCTLMADTLSATIGKLTDKKQSQDWAAARLKEIIGHEKYFGRNGASVAVKVDPSVAVLARQAGVKTRSDQEMTQSLLDELTAALKKHVASERTVQNCRELAGQLSNAFRFTRDPQQKTAWIEGLASIMRDKESFQITAPNKKPQTLRDPIADWIPAAIAQEIRAASVNGNQPEFTAWTALAGKFLPPVAPGEIYLNPQQAAAHPKMEPFSGTLLSPEGMLRSSSACKHDKPLTYKNILSPGIGGWLHTNMEAKPWLQVDLTADSELSGIVLVGRYEHPKDNPSRAGALPMKVQTSTDGKTWTDVATLETVQDVYRVNLEKSKTPARFVRVERAQASKQPAADLQFRNLLIYGRKL